MKICLWTSIPSHYQQAFVSALARQSDLKVVYFGHVPPERVALGWDAEPKLSSIESCCSTLENALQAVPDWRDRTHIVPGYGGPFQRQLARHLSRYDIPWADWAESSTPGWHWLARLPVKLWWTRLVSTAAIGSFAIGSQAEDDFAGEDSNCKSSVFAVRIARARTGHRTRCHNR